MSAKQGAQPAHRHTSPGTIVDRILANPLIGLSPWIVYSLVEGEGRLEESSAIAFGLALAILMIGWLRGSSPKLLEFSDVIFFGALVALQIAVMFAAPEGDTFQLGLSALIVYLLVTGVAWIFDRKKRGRRA